MTYSMDLRKRVVAARAAGESVTKVAHRFDVSRPAVRDWCHRAQYGELAPRVPGPKRPTKLTEADDRLICQQVAARPGVTAMELMPMLSIAVVESTVCRRLRQLGLRLKKRH